MTRKRLAKYVSQFGPEGCDPTSWLPVSTADMPPNRKEKFKRRKKAVDLYLKTDQSVEKIIRQTDISRSELYRIVDRAFEIREHGGPVGYLACIPGFRIKEYERIYNGESGSAGLMGQFLEKYPEIREILTDWALGKRKVSNAPVRGRNSKQIWLAFRDVCVELGIDIQNSYPFTNKDGGREAVRRYVSKIRDHHFSAKARILYGDQIGKLARSNGVNVPAVSTIPYECVQLDGHRLDAVFNARIQDPQGNTLDMPMSRIWLLVLIDTASRCVLGYKLSLSENYTSDDVLSCIASSLTPWEPKAAPTRISGYTPDTGLPSGVIDECAWRVFNTLQFDNAWSHLSEWVQERIIDTGAIEVVTNIPRSPRSNAVVERYMQTFEEVSLHKWPNTTGSNPDDPRRRKPEKAAANLCIGYEELELIADIAIANYNATPHSSLNGRSPIEYLRYRISIGSDLIRYAPQKTIEGLALFEREFKVTIRANAAQGHKPYVKFLGVRYTSKSLQSRCNDSNLPAILRVNIQDIRSAQLFVSTGECIGTVVAEQRWLDKPHSIAIRRAINALVKARKLHSESRQPVADYLSYLTEQAPLTRKARNSLLKTQQHTSTRADKTSQPNEKRKETKNKNKKRRKKGWVSLTTAHSR